MPRDEEYNRGVESIDDGRMFTIKKYWPNWWTPRFNIYEDSWQQDGKCVAWLKFRITNCLEYFSTAVDLGSVISDRLRQSFDQLLPPNWENGPNSPQLAHHILLRALQEANREENEPEGRHNVVIFWEDRNGQHLIDSVNYCFNLDFTPTHCDRQYQMRFRQEERNGLRYYYFGRNRQISANFFSRALP